MLVFCWAFVVVVVFEEQAKLTSTVDTENKVQSSVIEQSDDLY